MGSDAIGLGIIGCGSFVQRRILPFIHEIDGIKVVCLHNRDENKAKELAHAFNVPHAVSNPGELIKMPEVNAVYICSPNHLHKKDALACAKALKPTLCEKPLAPTAKEAMEIVATFRELGVLLLVGHSLRFKPSVRMVRERYASGQLGKLLTFRIYFSIPVLKESWRHTKEAGGGVLQDIGVHLIDLIQFISGQSIVSVKAFGHVKDADETVVAICQLSDGAIGTIECSLEQPYRSGFELVCERTRVVSINSLRQTFDPIETLSEIQEDGPTQVFPVKISNIYVDELKHFADVIRKKADPLIKGEIGVKNAQVIESILRSLK